MPAAVAIPAIIGAAGVGAQIYGAHKASSASKEAANIQSGAAQEVAQGARATADQAAQDISGAGAAAGEIVTGASQQANDLLTQQLQEALKGYDPYSAAGQNALVQLSELLQPGGGLDERFNFKFNPDEDPGYQFRLEQGQKAIEKSAAARGGLLSGGAVKSLQGYNQNLASQEFQNSYNRALETFKTNQAGRQVRLSGLAGLAGLGFNAAGQAGDARKYFGGLQSGNITGAAGQAAQFGFGGAQAAGGFRMQGEQIAGDALTGGANARAAGTVGSANAWNQGLQGAVNNGMNAVMLYKLLSSQTPQAPQKPS